MAFVKYERVPRQMNAHAYASSVNKTEPICLIVNPHAGAGRAGRQLSRLERVARRAFANVEIRLTEAPGHATALARQAVDDGFGIVAAVGGDGTCHEVVAGMVVDGRARSNRCAFTTIPFGTGSDLMKTLEIPRNLTEALWVAATGITLPTDVGLAHFHGPDGDRQELFINVAGIGANGEVVRRANRMDKRMGGRATFLLATVRTTLSYACPDIGLRWTDAAGREASWSGRTLGCFIANGAFCGGGMWVGRGGSMQDGLFDVTVLPPATISRQLVDARRLYDGRLDRVRGVQRFQASRLEVRADLGTHLPVDLDGEEQIDAPHAFELLPAALQVRGGWISNPVRGDRGRQFG